MSNIIPLNAPFAVQIFNVDLHRPRVSPLGLRLLAFYVEEAYQARMSGERVETGPVLVSARRA